MSGASKVLQLTRNAFKYFTDTKGFDRVMQKLEITDATPGTVRAKYTITEADVNGYGTLHGGWTAMVVDMMSTTALMNSDPALPGVSVDLSVSYMKAAKLGETVTIDAVTLRKGSKLSFSTVDIRNEAGELVAQGKHTKFLDIVRTSKVS